MTPNGHLNVGVACYKLHLDRISRKWMPVSDVYACPRLFLLKTGFWPSYCQISTDLDKILHTPIVVRNTLWADLYSDRRVGGSRPNQNDYVFCNTCNAY